MTDTALPLVILTGPTAVGKSELSLSLAKAIDGEIISADSMQVYRGMDVGSAKLMPSEQQGVPHHLLDILDPEEEFNVVLFQRLAAQAVRDICQRGHIPIVTGGTGFYIQALLYDIDFMENDEDTSFRSGLEDLAAKEGADVLYQRLLAVDPKACETIHKNNVKRVIRALEFYEKTGQRISEHNESQRQNLSPYRFAYFVLNDERSALYSRIDRRVDQMLENGLEAEVRRLAAQGCTKDLVSMQGLGYKEMLAYLNGELSLEEAVYIIKRDTRHFAKRQLTWFRRERDVIWLEKEQYQHDDNRILAYMLDVLNTKGIWPRA